MTSVPTYLANIALKDFGFGQDFSFPKSMTSRFWLFSRFLALQNLEFNILADFKILAFQNPELKILADFKILAF